jgi:hypothetical protein
MDVHLTASAAEKIYGRRQLSTQRGDMNNLLGQLTE